MAVLQDYFAGFASRSSSLWVGRVLQVTDDLGQRWGQTGEMPRGFVVD